MSIVRILAPQVLTPGCGELPHLHHGTSAPPETRRRGQHGLYVRGRITHLLGRDNHRRQGYTKSLGSLPLVESTPASGHEESTIGEGSYSLSGLGQLDDCIGVLRLLKETQSLLKHFKA